MTHWNKTCTANTHTARAVRRDLGSAPRRVCASCPTTNHVDPDAAPRPAVARARRIAESHVRARTRKKSMESYERATQHTIGRLHLLHRTESHKTVPGMASLSFFSRGFEKGTSLSSLLNLLTNFPEGRNGVQSIQFTIQRTFTNRLSS